MQSAEAFRSPTLLDAIGGSSSVEAVVKTFYAHVFRDPILAPFFQTVSRPALLAHQTAFFSELLGGGKQFNGRALAAAHAGLQIEHRHFTRVARHLKQALEVHGVTPTIVETVLHSVASFEPQIVNTRDKLEALRSAVEPHSRVVREHPLYVKLSTVEHVRVFMEHHVFAVWDFMCLLKALQNAVTCTTVPWVPKGDAEARRFINEIVVGEESDETSLGTVESHFEMYLRAMREVGANTDIINEFISCLKEGHLLAYAISKAGVPRASAHFVLSTMDVVHMNRAHAIAAAFTIGREAVIPGMFLEMVKHVAKSAPTLIDYFNRHIAIDGEEHGPLAEKLLESLCINDASKWNEATGAAIGALQARRDLWDAVQLAIVS